MLMYHIGGDREDTIRAFSETEIRLEGGRDQCAPRTSLKGRPVFNTAKSCSGRARLAR